jgi:hypothetical protein
MTLARHHSAERPTTLSTDAVDFDWYTANATLSESGIAQSNQHLPARKASLSAC